MPRLAPLTLVGRHARLEPLALVHVEPLLRAANESRETYRLTFVPEDAAAMRRYVEAALADETMLAFATVDARSGEVAGSTRFGNIEFWRWPLTAPPPLPAGPDVVEIGWTWLRQSAQRTALNSEAKLLMLGHAFEAWGVRRVMLKTDARNRRSREAIERLGMRFDGVLRAHMPAADGGVRDTAFYSMLPEEWPAARQRLMERLERLERSGP